MQPSASPLSPSRLYGLGSLKNENPDQKASFSNQDILDILHTVQHGSGDEKELAIDILVNLAAGKDAASADAQQALRALYQDPYGSDPSDPPVGQHVKDGIREELSKAAHSMCELALTGGFQPKDGTGRALSVTVAYLGAQHHGCSRDLRSDINQYVHSQMVGLSDEESHEKWLDPQRTVTQAELLSASEDAYGGTMGISESAINLHLDAADPAEPGGTAVQDFSKSMEALKKDLGVGQCRATWVHTGSKGYPHWMPLVLKRTGDKSFEVVLLNTDTTNHKRALQIVNNFRSLFEATGPGDASWNLSFRDSHAQDRAGHGCAPLGHEFLKIMGQALKDGDASPEDIANRCSDHWDSMSDADMTAMVLTNRAELVSARAKLGNETVMPDQVRRPSGASAPVAAQAKLVEALSLHATAGASALPSKLKQTIEGFKLQKVKNSEDKTHYDSTFSAFGMNYNSIAKLTGIFPQQNAIAKAPPESRELMSTMLNFQQTIEPMMDKSPLLANYERSKELKKVCTELDKSNLNSLVSHTATYLDQLMNDLAKLALDAGQEDVNARTTALTRFSGQLANISTSIQGLIDRVDDSIAALTTVKAHAKNGFLFQAKTRGGAVSMGDRDAHADAGKLLQRLVPLRAAMAAPNGILQKLSEFAKQALTQPDAVASLMRDQTSKVKEAEPLEFHPNPLFNAGQESAQPVTVKVSELLSQHTG